MSQPFEVWLAELLREFDDVVNTSKTLPPLPATNDVFHHIKTSGPPISYHHCRSMPLLLWTSLSLPL
jgi:hypothetical protein